MSHARQETYSHFECGEHSETRPHPAAHQRGHAEMKPYVCEECGMRFSAQSYLLSHQRIHTGETYSCLECGVAYTEESYLLRHMKVHARNGGKSLMPRSSSQQPAEEKATPEDHGLIVVKVEDGEEASVKEEEGTSPLVGTGPSDMMGTLENLESEEEGPTMSKVEDRAVEIGEHVTPADIKNEADYDEAPSEIGAEPISRGETWENVKAEEEDSSVKIKEEKSPVEIGREDTTVSQRALKTEAEMELCIKAEEEMPPEIGTEPGDTTTNQQGLKDRELKIKEEEIPIEIVIDSGIKNEDIKPEPTAAYSVSHGADRPLDPAGHGTGNRTIRKIYSCSECRKCFSERAQLLVHEMSHTREETHSHFEHGEHSENRPQEMKPYECEECGMRFSDQSYLLSHQKIHTGELYSCLECGVAYTEESYFLRHMRVHTRKEGGKSLKRGKNSQKPAEEKRTPQGDGLIAVNMEHGAVKSVRVDEPCAKEEISAKISPGDQGKSYACSECGATFTKESCLHRHVESHTSKKFFWSQSPLNRHKTIRAKEQPFHCSECGNGFAEQSDLDNHQALHNVCAWCGRRFMDRRKLLSHQTNRRRERIFKCNACSKSFPSYACLMYHMKGHHVPVVT